jgi:hypothetical protein
MKKKQKCEQEPIKSHSPFERIYRNHLIQHRRSDHDTDQFRDNELLRIAMLKEQKLESTLVARLKQLSPYSHRNYCVTDDVLLTPISKI